MEKQNRWRSPVLWTSIIMQLLVIGKTFGLWEAIGIQDSIISDAAAAIIQFLVIVGVFNDPTNSTGW
jgi:uncharacterized membrane protein